MADASCLHKSLVSYERYVRGERGSNSWKHGLNFVLLPLSINSSLKRDAICRPEGVPNDIGNDLGNSLRRLVDAACRIICKMNNHGHVSLFPDLEGFSRRTRQRGRGPMAIEADHPASALAQPSCRMRNEKGSRDCRVARTRARWVQRARAFEQQQQLVPIAEHSTAASCLFQ